MDMIHESLMLDPTSKTYLRWKRRPRHHFKKEHVWKRWNTRYAGNVAGCEKYAGGGRSYWHVMIDDRLYHAHRIVYALEYKIDPSGLHIDHHNGNGQDNNPNNLRLATNAENCWNRGANRNNKLGVKGVYFDQPTGKYIAKLMVNGRSRWLGRFAKKTDAKAARDAAATELHQEFAKIDKQP